MDKQKYTERQKNRQTNIQMKCQTESLSRPLTFPIMKWMKKKNVQRSVMTLTAVILKKTCLTIHKSSLEVPFYERAKFMLSYKVVHARDHPQYKIKIEMSCKGREKSTSP